MPYCNNVFIPVWNGRKEVYSDYVVKRVDAYGTIQNILNHKYCSFAIIDKEKDMLEKIKRIINEVENDKNQNLLYKKPR